MPTFITYDPSNITSTGWNIKTGPTRTVAAYRSRWQGSRTEVVLTIYDDGAMLAEAEAEADDTHEIERWLDDVLVDIWHAITGYGTPARGSDHYYRGWRVRVTDRGYVVQ